MSLGLAIATLIFFTFVPGLELRASLPVGFFTPGIRELLTLPMIAGICLVTNIGVGMLTFWLMKPVERELRRWGWFDRQIWPRIARARHKLHPYVEKYGEWGLIVFIGIPLPGTGAYTGAFGAHLLGFDRRRFWIANVFGVLMACVAVVGICLLIDQGVIAEGSLIRKLFLKGRAGATGG